MRLSTIVLWLALIMMATGMLLAGCTDNTRVRTLGGTMNVEIPAGKKLVNVTWKEQEIWYLVRDMRADEKPETWEFKEKSPWGAIQGTVVLTEKSK
jgi:hypothetical protein